MDADVWTCAQDDLEAILAARARAAGAQLRHRAELTSLQPAHDGVLATAATTDGRLQTIRARYVLGADGAHSMARQAAAIMTSRTRSAAHVFTPVSGMGLNLALHDATVAAGCLASAIRHGRDEVLDHYETTCKPLAEDLLAPELAVTLE